MKIQLFYSSKIKECYPCDNFKKWATKYHSDIEIEMIDIMELR